ncbi:Zinc finger DHHC-type containing 4 [Paragonimus skrjabini miyazakii]|uniref:Zinc finger DHHC-type containing 4 n=1 Tax=Paragonimus skrjabini miyazakii TaxID=59628 RepID=A0A8S9YPN5_9TREM|nr:Zinc finger DHHC-type containing 4 [Paragonimus skrjabini miyazakii]
MLREHIQETRLWQAFYVDSGGQIKPMDYINLVQHLFMSFPLVVPMLLLLALISSGLAAYLVLHLWLSCTNQTSTEFYSPSSSRGELAPKRPSYRRRYYDRGGLWANLYEVFGYQTINLLREMHRRLPAQMEFKTH